MLLQNIAQPGLVASSRHTGEDKYPNLRKSASHEDSDEPGKPEPDGEVPTLTRRKTRGYEIDPELERKVMRKVDWRLIPILSALFGFGLIDRNNIGLVRVSGMDEALGLSIGNRFTIVTVVMLIPLILFVLPSYPFSPDDNKFLTAEETELVLARIDNDRGDAEFDSLTWPKTVKYFFEAKLWGFAVLFGCASVPSYAIVTFLPIILEGMDFTIVKTQLLGAPPMLFTFVYMVVCAKISDRLGVRAPFLVLHAAVCIAGLVMVGWCTSNASSSSPQLALFFSELEADWRSPLVVQQNNNIIGQSKRAYSAALSSAFSGIGGIIASTVFRQQDFPLYRPGIIVSIASQVLTILLAGIMTFGFHLRNSKVKRRMSETLIEGRTGFLYTL
ncbi:hypothetical protein FRB98_003127 [Tulasnella sp. 332]|nr:hypothetical protein FRB98_003127 [Tulasnella sp. 332]